MIAFALLAILQNQTQIQPKAEVKKLILSQKGDLPIIISAPHGGTLAIPDAPLRGKTETPQFSVAWDSGTDAFAEKCAEEVFALTGKKPYFVIAKFSRKYADANRSEVNGTESEAGAEVYRQYHDLLRTYTQEVKTEFGSGLVIDIHGQGSEKATCFRGTNNRGSVKGFPEEMLTGEKSFLGVFEAGGVLMNPNNADRKGKENPNYGGGFITQTYGAKGKTGLMSIQLEFGSIYRQKSNIPTYAALFAKAVQSHWETYLQKR